MDALANLFGDDKKKKKSTRPNIPGQNTKLNFNPTKRPNAAIVTFVLAIFAVAGGLLFFSNLIPQIGNSSLRESVIESTRNFELEDEINGGLFAQSDRNGDTSHNIQSTFFGISVLNGNIKNVKGAKEFAQKLQLSNYEENLEYINYGIRLLKILGLLDEFSSKVLVDRIYGQILSHQELGSGFKNTKFVAPSVTASFYALDSINVLGKLEDFKKTGEFSNVIQFILSQKVSGGFIEREGENATISATYYSTRALLFDSENKDTLREMGDIAAFIYERQALNGAFLEDNEFYDISTQNTFTTLQALFSLYSLVKAEVEDDGVFGEFSSSTSKASAYIRTVLRGGRKGGIKPSLYLSSSHLPSNYLFLLLTDSFPSFNYGTIPEIRNVVVGVSLLLFLYGLFQFYKDQVEDKRILSFYVLSLRNIFVLSVVSLLSLYFIPSFSILFYLFLFSYIGTRFYSALQSDANTVPSDFLSPPLLTAFIHLLLLILLNSSTNGNCFTTFYFYYIFTAWSAISAFLSTYIFSNLMQNRKTQLYLSSAFIGWVFTLITTIIYITGSESWGIALQLIQINGQFPLLLVVLPFISLVLSFPAALLPLIF